MKYTYNKLIRDKLVAVMEGLGKKVSYDILSEDEDYLKELNKKIIEEANEFIEENDLSELADLFEVIYAIAELKDIDLDEVEKIRIEKRNKKGAFKDRIFLKTVIEE